MGNLLGVDLFGKNKIQESAASAVHVGIEQVSG
jgi:hypothetical protein